jgi:O-antigen/teichoic acid export membrane protein
MGQESLARTVGSALVWKATQTALVRGLSVARYLVVARLLAPEAFGLLAVAAAGVELFLQLTDIGLIPSLVQRRELRREHYDTAWTVGVLRGILVAAALFAAAPLIASAFAEPQATPLLRVLALRPLLASFANVHTVDAMRQLRFATLAKIEIPTAVVETVLAIVLAPTLNVWAIVVAALAAELCTLTLSYVVVPGFPRVRIDRSALASLLQLGRWLFVATAVGVAGETLLRAVISRRLGTADLGRYLLAVRLTAFPFELSTAVVTSVTFPLHSGLQGDDQRARRAFRLSVLGLFAILAPTYAVLVAVAPRFVQTVLGQQWEGTAPILALLSAVTLLTAIDAAAEPLLKGRGQGTSLALLRAVGAVLIVPLAWPLAGARGLVGAGVAILATAVVEQLVVVRSVSKALPTAFERVSSDTFLVVAAAAAGGVVAWAALRLPGLTGLLAASGAGLVTAYVMLAALDRRRELGLTRLVMTALPRPSRVDRRG